MLSASWAILRSSRAQIFCSGITKHSKIHVLSPQADSERRSKQPKHRNSPSEQEKNVQDTSNDYPIDVLNTQSTIRQLVSLINQQNHKAASAVMTDFISSLPTDEADRISAFRKLKPALLKHPRSNILLLMQLGIAYASMGHVRMIKEEVLPLMTYFASPEQLAHFELEMAILASSESSSPSGFSNEIFEGRSSDYELSPIKQDNSGRDAISLEDSSDRAAHYPEAAEPSVNFSDVFEDEGEEYMMLGFMTNGTDHASVQSTGVLRKMVSEGHYERAYGLLKEIQDLGIPIPLSLQYARPAVDVLKNRELEVEEKLQRFTSWFSLVPPEHLAPPDTDYAELRCLLVQSHLVHISLVIRFTLILAEKGYSDRLSVGLIPTILRCTSPEVGRLFLEDLFKAHERYLSDLSSNIPRIDHQRKRIMTNIRGQAVRALAYSGRLDEAIALLPDPNNPAFRLTTYTYNIVLQRLTALPPSIRQTNIDLVKKLRNSPDSAVRSPTTDFEDIREQELIEDRDHSGIFETASPVDFGEDLVAMLRYLKKHIVTKKRSDTAHPFTIVNFMSMYLATGRTRALKMLLEKAIRNSFFATSNFIFAEMLFYRRLQQPQLVIKTFMDHFWLSGVPREEVLSRYMRLAKIYENYDPSSGEHPPLQRFYPFDPSRTLPRGKMWPNRVHCNLTWDALVEVTTQDRAIAQLYGKLIDFAERGSDDPQSDVIAKADEVPISGLWQAPVGAAAFTPFMQRMMFYRGPTFGVRIMRDMLQLGVRPTTYHYTELAGFYARRGDATKVFLILDGMERGLQRQFPERHRRGVSEPISEYCLPPPTIVTYTSVLRGFLISKQLRAAQNVNERLTTVFEYKDGESRHLDRAIQHLKEFTMAGDRWVSFFFMCQCDIPRVLSYV